MTTSKCLHVFLRRAKIVFHSQKSNYHRYIHWQSKMIVSAYYDSIKELNRYCHWQWFIGLLPDTQNCGLCMRRECRERFLRDRFHRKPLVSYPGMHYGTCVTHVLWCMSGSLTREWQGKLSRHSWRMRNPQLCVSGTRPIPGLWHGEDTNSRQAFFRNRLEIRAT